MNTDLISKAKYYAISKHDLTKCTYDGKPYVMHLMGVVAYAEKYINLIPESDQDIVLAACWTHDVIEDCRETYNNVTELLGPEVADIVYLVTNEKGKTRKERALRTYPLIAGNDYASFVKCADRYANTTYSKNTKSSMYEKYIAEYPDFRNWLYKERFQPVWHDLDVLHTVQITV